MGKKEILERPIWTYREIMLYLGVKSKTTAIRIKARAIKENGGGVPFGSKYVKTDSVLALYGTSRKQELACIGENDE